MRFILLLSMALIIIGCFDSPTPTSKTIIQEPSIGFLVKAGHRGTADSIGLIISWYQLLSPVPEITIAQKPVDFKYDTSVLGVGLVKEPISYRIEYNGKVLEDTITVPDTVTNIICNGVGKDSLGNHLVDSSATYTVTWDHIPEVAGYQLSMRRNSKTTRWFQKENTFTLATDSVVASVEIGLLKRGESVASQMEIYYPSEFELTISPLLNEGFAQGDQADIIGNGLHAYYKIEGYGQQIRVIPKERLE